MNSSYAYAKYDSIFLRRRHSERPTWGPLLWNSKLLVFWRIQISVCRIFLLSKVLVSVIFVCRPGNPGHKFRQRSITFPFILAGPGGRGGIPDGGYVHENVRFYISYRFLRLGHSLYSFLDLNIFVLIIFLVPLPDWLSNFNCWMSTEMTHSKMSNLFIPNNFIPNNFIKK